MSSASWSYPARGHRLRRDLGERVSTGTAERGLRAARQKGWCPDGWLESANGDAEGRCAQITQVARKAPRRQSSCADRPRGLRLRLG
jgi:hypothetical protein